MASCFFFHANFVNNFLFLFYYYSDTVFVKPDFQLELPVVAMFFLSAQNKIMNFCRELS